MIVYRLLRVALHLLVGLFTCAVVFPFANAHSHEWRIRKWSGQLLTICGVQVEIKDLASAQTISHAMVIANHVSWLDIFVINSMHPCRFVAKSDVRDWPLIGWLCHSVGTIFIARGNRRDVRRIFENMVASIHAGERVAFFPEGTTSRQGVLLPFHANLFEAAIDADVPIQPYALRYVNAAGEHHDAIEFIGDMSFAQSIQRILKAKNITAQLLRLPLIETKGTSRRGVAVASSEAIGQALGLPISLCQADDIVDIRPETGHDLQGVAQ